MVLNVSFYSRRCVIIIVRWRDMWPHLMFDAPCYRDHSISPRLRDIKWFWKVAVLWPKPGIWRVERQVDLLGWKVQIITSINHRRSYTKDLLGKPLCAWNTFSSNCTAANHIASPRAWKIHLMLTWGLT